ncbi:hypothetical protein M406DRAFT_72622 [Cryphonectria parasitica EP155]|uniref:Uncharacterized protein n=1 Tax=Cryphonectria parasitica (strain ATCC 38755 / EP155) TaxID=660469 RepID=A0A9P4XXC4_CRYP1|nr:uncharacterized protein M406DRAFT_72622 [Cryphonectria parasitica EP155]KAF3762638.1 hypothetical protein M406DRAFT_72622 [Cryphonectria parasitica EP155]
MATNIIYTRPYTGGPYYSLPVPGTYPPRNVRLPVNGTSIATLPNYYHHLYSPPAATAMITTTTITTTTTTTMPCYPLASPIVYFPGTASHDYPLLGFYYHAPSRKMPTGMDFS